MTHVCTWDRQAIAGFSQAAAILVAAGFAVTTVREFRKRRTLEHQFDISAKCESAAIRAKRAFEIIRQNIYTQAENEPAYAGYRRRFESYRPDFVAIQDLLPDALAFWARASTPFSRKFFSFTTRLTSHCVRTKSKEMSALRRNLLPNFAIRCLAILVRRKILLLKIYPAEPPPS